MMINCNANAIDMMKIGNNETKVKQRYFVLVKMEQKQFFSVINTLDILDKFLLLTNTHKIK